MEYYDTHYMKGTAPGAYIDENGKVCAPSYINMLYNKTNKYDKERTTNYE